MNNITSAQTVDENKIKSFLDEVAAKIATTYTKGDFSAPTCNADDLKTAFIKDETYTDIPRMGIIEFSEDVAYYCHFSEKSASSFKYEILLKIAQETSPEKKWNSRSFLKGWNHSADSDASTRIKEIYNF
jgi:hypothetical protein